MEQGISCRSIQITLRGITLSSSDVGCVFGDPKELFVLQGVEAELLHSLQPIWWIQVVYW